MNYDITVWEMSEAAYRGGMIDSPKLEPVKIWDEKHDFIPGKGEEIQIDHNLYEVVKVSYDLQEDHIRLLVVKIR